MSIQTIMYSYIAICISVIIFNCACIIVFKRNDYKVEKGSMELSRSIEEQILKIANGKPIDSKHKFYLQKKLCDSKYLMAFDEALDILYPRYQKELNDYFAAIYSAFIYLTIELRKMDTMKIAYFAYILGKYKILKGNIFDPIKNEMLLLLNNESLYCRENAMDAIFSSGDCSSVAKALLIVDRSEYFHHSKLLFERLLEFEGSHKELIDTLWGMFNEFSVNVKVVILNYFRYNTGNMCKEILELMSDNNQDDEIRFSCIRYFGKYHYRKAHPLLVDFLESAEKYRWEYGAISARTLKIYPGKRTIEALKKALFNPNWYIRLNASQSLIDLNSGYQDLIDVFKSNDRYAREILQYRIERNDIETVV